MTATACILLITGLGAAVICEQYQNVLSSQGFHRRQDAIAVEEAAFPAKSKVDQCVLGGI